MMSDPVTFSIDPQAFAISSSEERTPLTLIHREVSAESPLLCIYAIKNDGPAELIVEITDAASNPMNFSVQAGETHYATIRTDQNISFYSSNDTDKLTASFQLVARPS